MEKGRRCTRPHIVCCARDTPEWRWISHRMGRHELSWTFVCGPARGQRALLELSWRAVRLLGQRSADLLVTHGPALSLRCSTMRRLQPFHTHQIAYSFHFDLDPSPAKCRLIARACRNIDLFVVYSRAEVGLYSRIFDIPRERFEVTYWGIAPPEPIANDPIVPGAYLCTIGGSARDYETLLEAVARVPDIPVVAVVRPHSLAGLRIPPNLRVFVDLPFERMSNVLAHSRGVIIPLMPSARSGHSVLVLALHHGKATIVSDVPGALEYLEGQHALRVPAAEPDAMAAAMEQLWSDPRLCHELGAAGLRFAREHCTEEAISEHFRACARRLGLLPYESSSSAVAFVPNAVPAFAPSGPSTSSRIAR